MTVTWGSMLTGGTVHKDVGKILLIAGAAVLAAEFIAGYQGQQATDPNTTAPGPGNVPVALWFANSIGKVDPVPGLPNVPLSYALLGAGAVIYFLGGFIERE